MEFELEIPKKQFIEHLGIDHNHRIVFSGAFGTGKTYFLERFFKKHESYEAIHLFPVNYSVASNEDIFELIKYDILFKLLEEDLDFQKVKIDKGTFLPFFLGNHGTQIIPFLLGVIPKVGGSLKEIALGLIDLDKKFNKEFKEANLTDQDRIISYLAELTKNQGSIKEEDFYTQLICSLVNQLKEKGKEIVLIIDDLDRIDPEHIFRILNVLAAHVDVKKDGDQNKFDFSKIILVCDIENIRKIFSNRYGADVDFSGYIDKFYSRSIFYYNLSGEMIKSINRVFGSVVLDYGNKEMSLNEIRRDVPGAIIKQILHSFIQFDLISIRVLKRIFSGSQNLKLRKIWSKGKYDSLTNNDIELVKSLDFLLYLFQDLDLITEKCKVLIGKEITYLHGISNEFFISEIVKSADFKKYYWNVNERPKANCEPLEFEITLDQKIFKYIINSSFDPNYGSDKYQFRVISIIDKSGTKISIEEVDFFSLLASLLEETDIKDVLNNKFEVT
ncbi:P-loop NTPase fold protein [Cyclobacterium marinum]|uniref:KAP P-loop domain protein n=1 Tax=Cyclobacterium marinum (strain ATCC 25205 / DSM 745 / LMG 13164 / NCIMB 1802) TaxID=880070 RepID=G0IV40_CYCMS|nr:P-loop NTPase fold protein [Cyclobacterium marinum]AEL27031.1 KAP P-loop domain protein [Cyclobacterium marinum DSM 745]